MLPPQRLSHLHPRHRFRKASLLFTEAEALVHGPQPGPAQAAMAYALSLAAFIEADPEASPEVRAACSAFLAAAPGPAAHRTLNVLRHRLLGESGQAPADWDLLRPLGVGGEGSPQPRPPSGMRVYLEDIRSPFNVGSMLRSSDAFGVEEVLLSPECADPRHPRASRSSMGAVDFVAWRRGGLDLLEKIATEGGGLFALELGGTPLRDFAFPKEGVVILGSEELGVSAQALGLARASAGVVSIPMAGAKASLNVGVALGVLLEAWQAALAQVSKDS